MGVGERNLFGRHRFGVIVGMIEVEVMSSDNSSSYKCGIFFAWEE